MGFSGPKGLADHRRIAHGYPKLKCKVEKCGSEFSAYYEYRSHQRTHMRPIHPEDRPFGCDFAGCDNRYLTKTDLENHMRAVHDYPKLKCSSGQCTAEFVSKRGLARHKKKHHN